ncbi:MAG: DUF5011 domain-containing protein [Clostridiales bacterium]|nr:DUF5011 domain-containing protein [Clostridiales bacterium]
MRFVHVFITIVFVLSAAFTLYVKVSDDRDYNAPALTCDEDLLELSVYDDTDVLLAHVSASDEKDGDLTSSVIVETISPFVEGSRAKATFAVCDSDNNVSKLVKDIAYSDYSAPEFSMSSQLRYYVGATKVDLMSAVGAYDVLEGDITSRIVVSSSDVDLTHEGAYPVTYKVTTSMGTVVTLTINAYVYETRFPQTISLSQYLVYTDVGETLNAEDYIESYPEEMLVDGYSGTYVYSLEITDDVDYSVPGVYYICYRIKGVTEDPDTDEEYRETVAAESYLAVVVREGDA